MTIVLWLTLLRNIPLWLTFLRNIGVWLTFLSNLPSTNDIEFLKNAFHTMSYWAVTKTQNRMERNGAELTLSNFPVINKKVWI